MVPPSSAPRPLPAAPSDALWNHAREVDAAFVSATDSTRGDAREWERFIFYRGLGESRLPFTVSTGSGGRVECGPDHADDLRHVFVVRVEKGRGTSRYLPSLRCGEQVDTIVPAMDGALPVDRFASAIGDDLAGRLVESGLYPKEARAMVNTWRTSYFTTDGVRVLFVLPQSWTDRFIPLKIDPAPDELVRVMVGRVELLTAERERLAEAAIAGLASADADERMTAFTTLRDQGRYVEPIVRRTLASTTSEQVRTLCRRLLLTDFVTDLRTSLTAAGDGSRVVREPVYVRAQLASVLREIGLTSEARTEGELALAELEQRPRPSMRDHASRDPFRALARAHEAAGHDADALAWYSDFVTFGSTFRSCSWCHVLAGPRDNSFFRDWWAGRKFAEVAWRTGEAPRLIEADEAALADTPGSLLAQIRLAYLYEARGEVEKSRRLWAQVDPRGDALPALAP